MYGGANPGLGLAILRIVVGVVFIAHGGPKLFGGVPETAAFLGTIGVPLPHVTAWIIASLETFGGFLLVIGYLVTPVAVLLTAQMVTGIFLVHLPNGFYVVGPGPGGVELNLVLVAGLLMLILVGPGHWTLQGRLQDDVTVV